MRWFPVKWHHRRAALHADRRGTAAAEFAVVGAMLALIVIGITDYALPVWQKMEVGNAARAGARYAAIHGFTAAAVTAAAQSATTLGTRVTVTPGAAVCGCPTATGIVTSGVSCGSGCAGAMAAGSYITVSTQISYTPLLSYAGLGSTLTITGSQLARLN